VVSRVGSPALGKARTVSELSLAIAGSGWEAVAQAISSDLGVEHRAEEPAGRVLWDFPELADGHARLLLYDSLERADREHRGLQIPPEG
jgi:hypothetical protein